MLEVSRKILEHSKMFVERFRKLLELYRKIVDVSIVPALIWSNPSEIAGVPFFARTKFGPGGGFSGPGGGFRTGRRSGKATASIGAKNKPGPPKPPPGPNLGRA